METPSSAGGLRPDVSAATVVRASSSKLWEPWMPFLGNRKREGLASLSTLTLWRPEDDGFPVWLRSFRPLHSLPDQHLDPHSLDVGVLLFRNVYFIFLFILCIITVYLSHTSTWLHAALPSTWSRPWHTAEAEADLWRGWICLLRPAPSMDTPEGLPVPCLPLKMDVAELTR